MTKSARLIIFAAVSALMVGVVAAQRPIPQAASYHVFAGPRLWLVLSNLPFLFVGVATWQRQRLLSFRTLAACVAITAFGSAYYHSDPTNETLFWDRLPMAVGFMALIAGLFEDRIRARSERLTLPVLGFLGGLSVVYWIWSERVGHGDLRPYLLVQFGGLVVVLLILGLFPKGRISTRGILAGIAWYGVAKILELLDAPIYAWNFEIASGHTLKHLAAAYGAWCVLKSGPDASTLPTS
jgi:hypothetical protein